MGQEISRSHFNDRDFEAFAARLRDEMDTLREWFREDKFSKRGGVGGFELEAWLIDNDLCPAPINEKFIDHLAHEMVFPELASFNVEFNTHPRTLEGRFLSLMEQELSATWRTAANTAEELATRLAMIGILPTVKDEQLCVDNMTKMKRYHALNDQVLRLREGKPIQLDIQGRDYLHTEHFDVMLEAAATSFQIHLKVRPEDAVLYYNLSKVISAPMVAIAANSPYLFGYDLWDETRIPLFEQAVAVTDRHLPNKGKLNRVTFGTGYASNSLLDCFEKNMRDYSILLPMLMDDQEEPLSHLRLHNGTIWRWNRPLIGFDNDGQPHLRIEHRVISAGPSTIDTIANAALYFGLVYALGHEAPDIIEKISFPRAKGNFYTAAKHGLDAEIYWNGDEAIAIRTLLTETLLPMAKRGLELLDMDTNDIKHYLGVIEARLQKNQNGANWQRAYVARHGHNMEDLMAAYLEGQQSGLPVHEWKL